MNMKNLLAVLFVAAAGVGTVCFQANGQTGPAQAMATNAVESMTADVALTRRVDNGAYGTSAYSFRLASQDLAVHHNNVDLVFNGAGRLYINPNGGMKSRIVDLGAISFASAMATPPADAVWQHDFIHPQAGHVYYQEVRDEFQNFAVLFLVTKAAPDMVTLRWKPMDAKHQVRPLAPGSDAGTMGIDGNGGNGGDGGGNGGSGGNGGNGI
jgi:hypothetical protein